jgi:ribosomal protein S18 acetylase RimI-like enzyme
MSVAYLAANQRVEVIPLCDLNGSDLSEVLAEETDAWRRQLEWDFAPSAELVVRFVDMRSLGGHALIVDNAVAGYAYFIAEDHKGLIGDLFVMERYRTWDREDRLLTAEIDALRLEERVKRVESQLMMLSSPLDRPLPYPHLVNVFDRTFMVRVAGTPALQASPHEGRVLLEAWRDERAPEVAELIGHAYHGHVDSEINDQYRSLRGARRFLENIVQYPGCGRFFRQGSFVGFDSESGKACGVVLASLVADQVGHITQLCVVPEQQGHGMGYELLRASLQQLEEYGCRRVSLTVTSSNVSAISLYERMGFARTRRFGAHVWNGL